MKSLTWTARAALGLLVCCLTSCVPFLHPLFTPDTIVVRDDLVGVWKEKPDEEESWTFTKAGTNDYTLVVAERDSRSEFQVKIVKLGETLFLDLHPSAEPLKKVEAGDFYKSALILGHFILKVKIGKTLELNVLEPNELEKLLEREPAALAHTKVEEDRLVITAKTADLQAFFKKHANNTALWGEATALRKQLL